MDPFSIVATTIGLAVACAQTASAVRTVISRFEDACQTLSDIYDTLEPVSAALQELERFLGAREDMVHEDGLRNRILVAVNGCQSTLAQLNRELDELVQVGGNQFRLRLRLMRGKESKILQLRAKLEHNKSSLSLLLQTLTARTVNELHANISPQSQKFKNIGSPEPEESLPAYVQSDIDLSQSPNYALLVSNPSSEVSSPESAQFAFDAEVTLSKAYQRTRVARKTKRKHDESDLAIFVYDDQKMPQDEVKDCENGFSEDILKERSHQDVAVQIIEGPSSKKPRTEMVAEDGWQTRHIFRHYWEVGEGEN